MKFEFPDAGNLNIPYWEIYPTKTNDKFVRLPLEDAEGVIGAIRDALCD